MSIAPIFLPPLAPGRYLPPSGYAPDELALARQLSLQGIMAPDKGLGLGRGAHHQQGQGRGLGEGESKPMRYRDKVQGLRRELQARRQGMVADKVMRQTNTSFHHTLSIYSMMINTRCPQIFSASSHEHLLFEHTLSKHPSTYKLLFLRCPLIANISLQVKRLRQDYLRTKATTARYRSNNTNDDIDDAL